MKIYLITRHECTWDEAYQHMVVCYSPKQCRQIASECCRDDDESEWIDITKSKCELISNYTGKNKKPFVLMSDYQDG